MVYIITAVSIKTSVHSSLNNLMCVKVSLGKVIIILNVISTYLAVWLMCTYVLIGQSSNSEDVCTCQKKKFGRMMKCENSQCEKQWFHFSCIGLSRRPLGVWYCQECDGKEAIFS